jgi:2-keto-4-pentenoate hydratase/2-oxohepta-3-ene-1,7-dioic acid hydratase in catechol pathway
MRLARLALDGASVVAAIRDDSAIPLVEGDQDTLIMLAVQNELPSGAMGKPIPLSEARFLPPISRPPSFRDFLGFEGHVRNAQGGDVDSEWYEQPHFYFGNPAGIVGPEDGITPPTGTRAFDYELEVACIIGRESSDLDPADPSTMGVIAGWTILNDWTARDIQTKEMRQRLGPVKGKDFATSLGPWLATANEMKDGATVRPAAAMRAMVNGVQWSSGELSDIYFSWTQILGYASAGTRLLPGDIIGSGTCGTGCILELRQMGRRNDRHWLQVGDRIELQVDGLGQLRNHILPPRDQENQEEKHSANLKPQRSA